MSDEREQIREWLGSHGLPHNEVEGDLLIDYIIGYTEKAIRQAVGEEMLELVGGEREWDPTEPYDNPDMAQGYNEAISELRQKIKEWQGGEE